MLDLALKQRLLGASILIALAVIFVPMLFDEPVKIGEVTNDIAIPPPPPVPEFETRTFPAYPKHQASPAAQASTETPAAGSARDTGTGIKTPVITPPVIVPLAPLNPPAESDTAGGDEASPAASATETSLATESLTVDAAAVKTPAKKSPADAGVSKVTARTPAAALAATRPSTALQTAGGSWQVQAASFASSNNAERLASQLEELGYRTSIDTVYRAEQPLHRVRAIGFSDERAAAEAASRIANDLPRLRPRVVAPEGETRTLAAAGEPVQRYAVQLGVFADSENAERLLQKVRAADFAAFIERQKRPEGIVQVVKVGPLLSRDDAAAVRRRLSETLAIDGLIVDYL